MNDSPVYIGTSGWTYDHWKGCFYPPDLAKSKWFDFYAARFNAVEVNATFYRSFGEKTYLGWKERAPAGFGYVLKVPKAITHVKMLRNVEEDIFAFSQSAHLLADTFEMFLLQLAPGMPCDPGLLRSTLQAFPDPGRVAVEFRGRQWLTPEMERLLSSLGAAFCNADSPGHPLTDILTSDRAYLRLHGHDNWYASDYSDVDLQRLAGLIRHLRDAGAKQIYVFFNNDFGGHAPANALSLRHLLDG
jgi:uncharacterized protein YecE (DUF72 family)